MPRARTRIEELLKWQMRLPTTPTFCNARGGGKGFPSRGPGGYYLAAEPSKLNKTLYPRSHETPCLNRAAALPQKPRRLAQQRSGAPRAFPTTRHLLIVEA